MNKQERNIIRRTLLLEQSALKEGKKLLRKNRTIGDVVAIIELIQDNIIIEMRIDLLKNLMKELGIAKQSK